MGRHRKIDKKIPQTFAITPYTIAEMDKFIDRGSRGIFVETAIINELRRRKETK